MVSPLRGDYKVKSERWKLKSMVSARLYWNRHQRRIASDVLPDTLYVLCNSVAIYHWDSSLLILIDTINHSPQWIFQRKWKVKGENWKVWSLRGFIETVTSEELHLMSYLILYRLYAILWQRRHWDESRGRLRTMPRRGGEKPTLVGLIYHWDSSMLILIDTINHNPQWIFQR